MLIFRIKSKHISGNLLLYICSNNLKIYICVHFIVTRAIEWLGKSVLTVWVQTEQVCIKSVFSCKWVNTDRTVQLGFKRLVTIFPSHWTALLIVIFFLHPLSMTDIEVFTTRMKIRICSISIRTIMIRKVHNHSDRGYWFRNAFYQCCHKYLFFHRALLEWF